MGHPIPGAWVSLTVGWVTAGFSSSSPKDEDRGQKGSLPPPPGYLELLILWDTPGNLVFELTGRGPESQLSLAAGKGPK